MKLQGVAPLVGALLGVGFRLPVSYLISWYGGSQPRGGGRQELNRIRVLLADDHEAMLERIAELVKTECDVVGTATDGQQALDAAGELNPDVLVLDISMPVLNGIEAAHQLKKAGHKARIVFLTVHDDPDFAREALAAGALGYVIKSRIASDLVTAIKAAYAGRLFLSPSLPEL
jgi:DNA-binding NarL/FixJ family response regulator